jgi:hypothetical protein
MSDKGLASKIHNTPARVSEQTPRERAQEDEGEAYQRCSASMSSEQ